MKPLLGFNHFHINKLITRLCTRFYCGVGFFGSTNTSTSVYNAATDTTRYVTTVSLPKHFFFIQNLPVSPHKCSFKIPLFQIQRCLCQRVTTYMRLYHYGTYIKHIGMHNLKHLGQKYIKVHEEVSASHRQYPGSS